MCNLRKTFLACLLAFAAFLSLGCESNPAQAINDKPPIQKETETIQKAEVSAAKPELKIGSQSWEVALEDNPSVEVFLKRLPLTVEMTELNGNEKYYILDESLPADDTVVGEIHAGDLMLYDSRYVGS